MPKLANLVLLAPVAILLVGCGADSRSTMSVDESDTEPETNLQPPAEVTKAVFSEWRDARRGERQAELQNNPYWQWILESETSAFHANEHFGGPSSFDGNPVWEASRFGQSKTNLPDGRQVLIAGEHEDH